MVIGSKHSNRLLKVKVTNMPACFISFYSSRELFMPHGTLVQVGDVIKRPKLARTLERISHDPHAYYNGSLARDVAADIQEYS